jgi:hypothetical protein
MSRVEQRVKKCREVSWRAEAGYSRRQRAIVAATSVSIVSKSAASATALVL